MDDKVRATYLHREGVKMNNMVPEVSPEVKAYMKALMDNVKKIEKKHYDMCIALKGKYWFKWLQNKMKFLSQYNTVHPSVTNAPKDLDRVKHNLIRLQMRLIESAKFNLNKEDSDWEWIESDRFCCLTVETRKAFNIVTNFLKAFDF